MDKNIIKETMLSLEGVALQSARADGQTRAFEWTRFLLKRLL